MVDGVTYFIKQKKIRILKAQIVRKRFITAGSDPAVAAVVCDMSTSHRVQSLFKWSSLVTFLWKSSSALAFYYYYYYYFYFLHINSESIKEQDLPLLA